MSRQKLSYRMHTTANKGVVTGKWKKDVRTTIALWAYEVAALENKIETMMRDSNNLTAAQQEKDENSSLPELGQSGLGPNV
mgnify:CR=1 FL=1